MFSEKCQIKKIKNADYNNSLTREYSTLYNPNIGDKNNELKLVAWKHK